MEQNPIRIAHIMGKWLGGGVESVVMNYYRHIDRTKSNSILFVMKILRIFPMMK